jgi:hypothetical protein
MLVLAGLLAVLVLLLVAHRAGRGAAERAVRRWSRSQATKRRQRLRRRVLWTLVAVFLAAALIYRAR